MEIEQEKELRISVNKGKQELFCSLPDSIFEGLFGGAKGGGKSHALRILPLLREWYKVPTFHGIILRRTYPELEKHQIMEAHKIYPYFGGKYNSMYKRYVFPSGARIQFGSAEYESDIKNYDSGEYHYIAFDELTSFTEFQYRYMLGMCRSSDKRLPHIVRSGTNPGNIGHSWVRERFVEPHKEGSKIILDKVTGMKRIFIQAFATDNPVLLEATPDYLDQLELLPEAERRAKKYGDWFTFSGQVFKEFRSERFPDEPENAVHVLDFEVPKWCPKILSIDWGFEAMTYALWGGILSNKRVAAYREYAIKEATVEQWGTSVAELSLQDDNLSLITVDPSAWQNRGTGTVIEQFVSAWKRVTGKEPAVVKADNDRISGKMLIHEYLRCKPLPDTFSNGGSYNADRADAILRLEGLEKYKSYLSSFCPRLTEKEILPRLIISRNCPILIKTIPLCVYDDRGRDGKNPEDIKEFAGDDPIDNLRYLLKSVEHFFDKSKSNEIQFQEQQEIVRACERLEQTKDQTSFYRKLEMIEEKKNTNFTGIKINYGRRRRAGVSHLGF